MEGYVFLEQFSSIKDFRQSGKVTYQLADIIFLAIAAVVAGADSSEDIELFGRFKIDWLQSHNGFENGIPSWHTISRVMSLIASKRFLNCFVSWMGACQKRSKGRFIAIDGKTLRSS